MLLLCSNNPSSSQQCWSSAGLQVSAQGWPLKVLQVLPQGTNLPAPAVAQAAGHGTSDAAAGLAGPGVCCAADCEGTWGQLSAGCGGVSAVLVRPDGHIAWVAADDLMEQHQGSLVGAAGDQDVQQGVLLQVLRDVLHYVPQH